MRPLRLASLTIIAAMPTAFGCGDSNGGGSSTSSGSTTVATGSTSPSDSSAGTDTGSTTTADPDRCALDPDPGPCEAAFPRYYYDAEHDRCEQFIWGGCDGVVPFDILADCVQSCVQTVACDQFTTQADCEAADCAYFEADQFRFTSSGCEAAGEVGFCVSSLGEEAPPRAYHNLVDGRVVQISHEVDAPSGWLPCGCTGTGEPDACACAAGSDVSACAARADALCGEFDDEESCHAISNEQGAFRCRWYEVQSVSFTEDMCSVGTPSERCMATDYQPNDCTTPSTPEWFPACASWAEPDPPYLRVRGTFREILVNNHCGDAPLLFERCFVSDDEPTECGCLCE